MYDNRVKIVMGFATWYAGEQLLLQRANAPRSIAEHIFSAEHGPRGWMNRVVYLYESLYVRTHRNLSHIYTYCWVRRAFGNPVRLYEQS